MNRLILSLTLIIACGALVFAQTQKSRASADASSSTSVSKNGDALNIESGTRLSAQLQSTLDARRAKVGDRVVLKTTEAIKANGRTVVNKGALLLGHVTEVQQRSKDTAQSRIGLVFDTLEKGTLQMPISATITSITRAQTQSGSALDDDPFGTDASGRSTSSSRGSQRQSGGGLLGTVGGVVDTTTQTAGNVVGGIRISQSTGASAEGGSILSLNGGDLRLEKSTTFHLTLNSSASVNDNQ